MSSAVESPRATPSIEELVAYGDAALHNAAELAEEASLLAANGHYARAYFLSVASMEETGKCVLLYDARGRNLKDPAIFSRLTKAWSDHGEKITSAFVPWLSGDLVAARRDIMKVTEIMGALRNGREPAMYSDLRADNHKPQLPSEVVSPSAAEDCVRLAVDCLNNARTHLSTRVPIQYTRDQDRLFILPRSQYQRVMNNPDFFWYLLAEVEAGRRDFAAAVVSYRDHFELLGKKFHPESAK